MRTGIGNDGAGSKAHYDGFPGGVVNGRDYSEYASIEGGGFQKIVSIGPDEDHMPKSGSGCLLYFI